MGVDVSIDTSKIFENFKKLTPALIAVLIFTGLILFLPESTEGVSEGQTTAMTNEYAEEDRRLHRHNLPSGAGSVRCRCSRIRVPAAARLPRSDGQPDPPAPSGYCSGHLPAGCIRRDAGRHIPPPRCPRPVSVPAAPELWLHRSHSRQSAGSTVHSGSPGGFFPGDIPGIQPVPFSAFPEKPDSIRIPARLSAACAGYACAHERRPEYLLWLPRWDIRI